MFRFKAGDYVLVDEDLVALRVTRDSDRWSPEPGKARVRILAQSVEGGRLSGDTIALVVRPDSVWETEEVAVVKERLLTPTT